MNTYTRQLKEGFLIIHNDGPLIRETNFWDTAIARTGRFYVSASGGAIRLLIPDGMKGIIPEMASGTKHVILSHLKKHLITTNALALEILFEDGSKSPFCLHTSEGGFDRYPVPEDCDLVWRFTAWIQVDGRPSMCLDLPAYIRTVYKIPCLQPWKSEPPTVFGVSWSF